MKINELRRSSAVQPKQSSATQIIEYAKTISDEQRSKTFISFTRIEKLGINPSSEYSTPNGIYSYPLNYVLEQIESIGKDSGMDRIVPFAGNSSYLNIFEIHGNVIDLADSDSVSDGIYALSDTFNVKINEVPYSYYINSQAKAFWSLSLYIASGKSENPNTNPLTAKRWNAVFRKAGIDAVVDSSGMGVIHGNEPTQAVCFTPKAIKLIKRIRNTRKDGASSKASSVITSYRSVYFFLAKILMVGSESWFPEAYTKLKTPDTYDEGRDLIAQKILARVKRLGIQFSESDESIIDYIDDNIDDCDYRDPVYSFKEMFTRGLVRYMCRDLVNQGIAKSPETIFKVILKYYRNERAFTALLSAVNRLVFGDDTAHAILQKYADQFGVSLDTLSQTGHGNEN